MISHRQGVKLVEDWELHSLIFDVCQPARMDDKIGTATLARQFITRSPPHPDGGEPEAFARTCEASCPAACREQGVLPGGSNSESPWCRLPFCYVSRTAATFYGG